MHMKCCLSSMGFMSVFEAFESQSSQKLSSVKKIINVIFDTYFLLKIGKKTLELNINLFNWEQSDIFFFCIFTGS